jgi:hypothetical protein
VIVAAFAIGGADGGDADALPPVTSAEPAATVAPDVDPAPPTSAPRVRPGRTAPPGPTPASAVDPLCTAHSELERAVARFVPADTPADFEAFTRASLAFFDEAAGLVDPPHRRAFVRMAAYQREVVDFYEAREWRQLTIADLLATPPPTGPSGIGTTIGDVLADRCRVVVPVDRP